MFNEQIEKTKSKITSIRVKLFASAREAVGAGEISLEFSNQVSCSDLRKKIIELYPMLNTHKIPFVLAVNHNVIADESTTNISNQDEVAVLPPISGG